MFPLNMGFFCKFSRENQSLLIQQIVTALPFAVRMSVAVAVTSPELVLAVEVCKDPGQKDSVLMHKVGEHVKKCQEYEAGLSDLSAWRKAHCKILVKTIFLPVSIEKSNSKS